MNGIESTILIGITILGCLPILYGLYALWKMIAKEFDDLTMMKTCKDCGWEFSTCNHKIIYCDECFGDICSEASKKLNKKSLIKRIRGILS